MPYIIAGLGNPGEEYRNTRHNVGRMMLEAVAKAFEGEELSFDKKTNALTSEVVIGKEKVKLIAPETFMNNSGKSIGPLVTSMGKVSPKKAEKLVVIYDDFHLPLGTVKISFNRSSGGHNGLESIIKHAKTEGFIRIRVGVAPETAKGVAKVPTGDKVEKFILGPIKKEDMDEIKKISKRVVEAVELIVTEGREKATGVVNAR